MIPIRFSWDTRKRSILLKWNGFFSATWEGGKVLAKILGISIPFRAGAKRIHLPGRWIDLKRAFSLLKKWKVTKVEGTVSFPDPMVNGVLYGLASAVNAAKTDPAVHLTVNFLGENWCSGEAQISPKTLFSAMFGWIFPLFRGRGGRS